MSILSFLKKFNFSFYNTTLICFFIISIPSSLYCCTCITTLDSTSLLQESIKKADNIVIGTVVNVDTLIIKLLSENFEYKLLEYKINVNWCIKGKKDKTHKLKIITGLGSGDCGYPFKINEIYIIFSKYRRKFDGIEKKFQDI